MKYKLYKNFDDLGVNGKEIGRFSESDLIQMAQEGRIRPEYWLKEGGILSGDVRADKHPRIAPLLQQFQDYFTQEAQEKAGIATAERDSWFPPPNAECYLKRNNEKEGPYTPSQIKSMWDSGAITADTLYIYSKLTDWCPVKNFCQATTLPLRSEPSSSARKPVGILLAIAGVFITVFFTAFYDTSVRSEGQYISGVGYVEGSQVVNLGKQQNRLIGVIVGIAIGTVGTIMAFLPERSHDV